MTARQFALTLSCPDQPGIVAAVTTALFERGANILEAQQHNDGEADVFFARFGFVLRDDAPIEAVREAFAAVAERFRMQWRLREPDERTRVLLLVSKFDHCLADLLYRWRIEELPMDIVGVVSNHPRESYRHLDLSGLAFDYLPVTRETKAEQEAEIWRIVQARDVELVVLARYMQILSSDLAGKLSGRCINIHHSFLPGFKGARPYHQAHARGVKVIGATAHYVTSDLDEGPIIEQDVERVSHTDTPGDLIRKGRDVERRVLSRAVSWHLERRIVLNGDKTVVFKN
ncbi:MAG: formyltetrahydrofolate deformylase [Phenylobacterium sp.]|uniref:formyltetrahydrofolate deformylase n=1 Tax=Phenylobacterium sp. TaxID=1871053 RepID=UPI0025EFD8ED|nr:formyltetrahydrofolate deformylase [Phenylobacterium sp.]MBI1200647.1 formyltetrahydrofolate deformylase [Phenylobacterium sp.]